MTEQTNDPLADVIARAFWQFDNPNSPWLDDEQHLACYGSLRRGGRAWYLDGAAHVAAVIRASGAVGDEYHTMTELYEYRMLYNAHAAHGWLAAGIPVVKSRYHSDGDPCFGGGWFIVVASLPTGQVSNHYRDEHWDLFDVPEVQLPPEYDGHTPRDAADRLLAALHARASGAGLGGTTREQIARALMEWAGDEEDEFSQAWLGAADAVLALRPDPAPDDTIDLRAETWTEQSRRLAGIEGLREENRILRAELAALREGIERLADAIDGEVAPEHDHGPEDGYPECPACVSLDLRALLGGTP